MEDSKKIIIYQVLTRLFGNRNQTRKENGSVAENGVGKMEDFTPKVLKQIRDLGVTHVWFTGIIRHATATDYSQRYDIPRQHAEVVKGKAGSPYAITDYYDVDPDLAVDVEKRMQEWESLIARTHHAGLKVIMDFVPNHVAREYRSICKPNGVEDLGENDRTDRQFDQQNNFYYCPNQELSLGFINKEHNTYHEMPAKATGNDHFDNCPGVNDWYETVKLNYGVDYCDTGGRSYHFDPIPNTWLKMTDILLYWMAKGIDGFRCDMVEMVPTAFWAYAISIVKKRFPKTVFIGEVYVSDQYRAYIESGFDYLYDKVGMYDCLRDVICGNRPAGAITYQWQHVDDINERMLYFLENHDEQRIASDFFCGDARKAIPGVMVSALMRKNPFMLYAGQEYGERGMDKEGFSGIDGRTSIFDYWSVDAIRRGYFAKLQLKPEERKLVARYKQILNIAKREQVVAKGDFFDLIYVNPMSDSFDPRYQYAFLRKYRSTLLFIIVNFSDKTVQTATIIPEHAFDCLRMAECITNGVELLTGKSQTIALRKDGVIATMVSPYSGCIFKFNLSMTNIDINFNDHNKEDFPPAHTAEHLLNQTMVRMFGCERSNNAHIERKKSKITYILDHKPDRKEEKAIEDKMNELIQEDLPVTYEVVDRDHLPTDVKTDRLPADASDMLRLVRIGDYDVCLCIGKHVRSTSQIGRFEILGTNWDEAKHAYRIRFKVVQ
ncbi:alpha amylase, catalytic domain protein [Hoylesella oralis ATCC 33269]|uniref:Alpha amylase, catalytic domain protein n=1 Tax=Hoylesella oralis ATCC 33269 TaxID=873533 RepID=E7RSP1_9BACT|nr:alpha-amylase family protein [Hoylesella oralis]EFZ36242.1 alpha amylase, catalytic domain protein [Hoylesella oralis ATCC 33269]EPH19295.1 hypothetical protein HMPREF1475_00185 [Hoylesella oralis HGA0225]SHG01043.1 Glycosidase [Hoylesella oralis]